jgi:hypothetical protein
MARDLAVGVLKQRLGWVAERRALFGALAPAAGGGLPGAQLRRLMPQVSTGRAVPAEAAVRGGEMLSR